MITMILFEMALDFFLETITYYNSYNIFQTWEAEPRTTQEPIASGSRITSWHACCQRPEWADLQRWTRSRAIENSGYMLANNSVCAFLCVHVCNVSMYLCTYVRNVSMYLSIYLSMDLSIYRLSIDRSILSYLILSYLILSNPIQSNPNQSNLI